MLLVFDLGNTNIVFGGFDGTELLFEYRLKTDPGRTIDEYAALIFGLLHRRFSKQPKFKKAIVSSVVPPLTQSIVRLIREFFELDALVVGPGIKTGLEIKISNPNTVGADRVVNAVAAKELFGVPALVVDFGTATTFDYISKSGAYEGGVIAPGVNIGIDSLVRHTAQLPRIELIWPQHVVGKSTIAAMQSGAVLGYGCMVDGILDRIIEEVGPVANVIATGGLGELFCKHSTRIKLYDPHLILKGMRIIADLNE